MLTAKTVLAFIEELSSNSPAPGGGSVAALAGSLGSALTSMVCRLTIGKKKYLAVREEMESILKRSEELRAELTSLIDRDTEAFNEVMRAYALPKVTNEQIAQRMNAVEDATKQATLIPFRVMQICAEAIDLAATVAEKGNTNSLSDAGVSALMIQVACKGAHLNVQINLGSLKDRAFADETSRQALLIVEKTDAVCGQTLEHVRTSLIK